eukprot:1138961-Pelagomonas_calceolata.AAC.3
MGASSRDKTVSLGILVVATTGGCRACLHERGSLPGCKGQYGCAGMSVDPLDGESQAFSAQERKVGC